MDAADARHFEGEIRRNKAHNGQIFTQRWNINSEQLSSGDPNMIKGIHIQIADYHNTKIGDYGLMPKYKINDFQVSMIRVTVQQVFINGKDTALIDFIDPCDSISQMFFYADEDPFNK